MNPNKMKIHRSRSRLGLSPTPSCTAQTFEVTTSTSPTVSRSTFGTVPTFGFQNKSNNIFGSSTENRFGTSSVFSFGSNSTFPGFGNVQPNNSPGQIMPCGFKTSTSDNIESIKLSGGSCSGIKFKPFSDKELLTKNGSSETTNVTFQCITFMNEFEDKSFEELRYEDYLLNLKLPILYEGIDIKKDPYHKEVKSFLHDRKKDECKPKSSVVVTKAVHSPYDFSKFSIFDNFEQPKIFQKVESKFNKTFEELWKSTKAVSPENVAVHTEAVEKLTQMVNSLSFRLDQLEKFSYQNSCPTKENSADLLPWILYKPKLKLTEKKVPEDLEVQRLAGVLNCVILTVSEQDRKEIELLMVLVSTWPSLPDYVKTFTYNKMEVLWQALSSTIRSEEHQKSNKSPIANERHPYIKSPISFPTKTESP